MSSEVQQNDEIVCPTCKGSGWDNEYNDECTRCWGFGNICNCCMNEWPSCKCYDDFILEINRNTYNENDN